MSMILSPELRAALPTHLDLPCSDGIPAEYSYQPFQSALLTSAFVPFFDQMHPEGDYFVGADQGIYWMLTENPMSGCRAPDWFFVPGVPRMLDGEMRRSYVLWQEMVPPTIVIEYVSNKSKEEWDDTEFDGKFWVYEKGIKAAYYVIWDSERDNLEVYERRDEQYYRLQPNAQGRYRISPLKLELGTWPGEFQGYLETWLRAWNQDGVLLPTAEEREESQLHRAEAALESAEFQKQRAESAVQREEMQKQRADKLAAKLRELGIDPTQVSF